MRSTIGTKFLRTLIAAGYLLMCLLAVGIMYLWFYEWKEIEALETENRRINASISFHSSCTCGFMNGKRLKHWKRRTDV